MKSAAARAGEAAFRHQEIAFSVCMGGVALLARGDPDFSPQLLWAFAALLAFNLGYHVLLRRRGDEWTIPLISMAVNMTLVTAVLSLSGGQDSPFWPMYFLPIFTACLYLDARHVAFAAAASIAFLGCLYLGAPAQTPLWAFAEFALKAAVLAFSGGVTAAHAFRERRASRELASVRGELDALAASLERLEQARLEAGGGLPRLLSGLIYDLNGRVALIRGRAELLAATLEESAPQAEDARAVAESARALGRFGSDLLRVLRRAAEEAGDCEVGPLLEQVLGLVEHRLRPRGLRLERRIEADLPAARVGAPHLQQALLDLLDAAVDACRREGTITASIERGEDELSLRLAFEAPDGYAPDAPSAQRRLLEPFGASVEALGMGRSCAYAIRLPLGAGRGVRR
ncbi:MAG: hypothetical protein KGM24_07660 [Elusimicrobia bacterium]|nr:hypothetical protein [Elusimicrobiota bacterium]